ncbi:MAG: formate/nitrite transporter family protein [Lachnospiraceae bacterium]|nr:formate/nitrite transporter family protein [Lachnospiraceae bacterium]
MREAIDKYIAGCQTKVSMSKENLIAKSILAGALIGMGAAASSVAAHTIPDVGLARLAAAAVFPVGLMMVILLGAELFTGDCLMAMSISDGKHSMKEVVRVLISVYIGNFIGAAVLALLINMSGQLNYSGGMLGAYTIKVAMGKANISFSEGLTSGLLCNILVCAAVLMAICAKDVTGKLIAVFFTIMLFVTAGFEHCVANMYYITAGLLAKMNPTYAALAMEQYGYGLEQMHELNVYNFLVTNLIPVTIGNILGGIVFLGLPLYYMNVKKAEKNDNSMAKEDMKNGYIRTTDVAGIVR